ncbi:hypothetical protein KEM55_003590, partial [Ascosphaera atra]
ESQYRALQEYESALAREPNAPETQVRCHVANMATQIFRAAWQHQSRRHVLMRWSEVLRELQQGREYTPRRCQPPTPIARRTRAMALAAVRVPSSVASPSPSQPGPAPLSGVTGASRYHTGPTTPLRPVYSQHTEEELRTMRTGVVAPPATSPEEVSSSDDESREDDEPREGERAQSRIVEAPVETQVLSSVTAAETGPAEAPAGGDGDVEMGGMEGVTGEEVAMEDGAEEEAAREDGAGEDVAWRTSPGSEVRKRRMFGMKIGWRM